MAMPMVKVIDIGIDITNAKEVLPKQANHRNIDRHRNRHRKDARITETHRSWFVFGHSARFFVVFVVVKKSHFGMKRTRIFGSTRGG